MVTINKEWLYTKDYFLMSFAFESSNVLNDFEKKFFKSLNRESIFYTFESVSCHDGKWQKNYSEKVNKVFGLSKKQTPIYLSIIKKFEKLDLYQKYNAYFKMRQIDLSDFDKGYLETFIGEHEETDNFKKWVQEMTKQVNN